MKVDKAERARGRRELKAWIALKREQLNAAIRDLREQLKQQIAAKREQLKRRASAPAPAKPKKFPSRAQQLERELKKLKPGTQPYWDAHKQLSDARFNEQYRARQNEPTLGRSMLTRAEMDAGATFANTYRKPRARKAPAKAAARKAAPAKKKARASKRRR